MDRQIFKAKLLMAESKKILADSRGQQYWTGFMRGLRRYYHGEAFGTEDEHTSWMNYRDSSFPDRQELGRGYLR